MEKKNFTHQRIEKCKLSKKSIDTSKERYIILLDCNGRDIETIGFYNEELLKDLIKGQLESVRKEILEKYRSVAGGMMNQLKGVLAGNQNGNY